MATRLRPPRRRASSELALLMRAAESLLLAARSERDVLSAAVTLLDQHFGYGTHYIMLFDPGAEELYVASASGVASDRPEVTGFRTRLGHGLTGVCALERGPVNVPDVRKDTRYIEVLSECASELCVPILTRDRLLGAVCVQSPETAAFSVDDERVLTAFSQLVALALIHAEHHGSYRRDLETMATQLAELESLHQVAQRAAAIDLPGTLRATVETLQKLTTADSSALWLWRPDEERLELAALVFDPALYPADYEERLRSVPVGLGEGLVGWVAQHGEAVLVGDTGRDARARAVPGISLEDKCGIVVPIMAEQRVLGVLRLVKMGLHSLSREHLRLARTLADECALALVASDAQREQVSRLAELAALHDTSVGMGEASTPRDVLAVVLRGALRLAEAEAGLVWARGTDGKLSLAASENVDADAVGRLPPGPASLAEEMLQRSRPLLLPDLHEVANRPPWAPAVPALHSAMAVPLASERVAYGALYVLHSRIGFFRPQHLRGLEVLAAQAGAALARAHAFEEAHRLAITDDLTGFHNARHFTERLQQEIQRAARYGRPLSLVMLDSDSLKMVNDRFGHAEGNRHLVELANTIRAHVRATDIVARYGGDEFVILMPETELWDAVTTAERIRQALRLRPFVAQSGERVDVTISAGAASYPEIAQDADSLFRHVDRALYIAKRQGKDRVEAAPPA